MDKNQESYNSMGRKAIGEMNRHNLIWKDNKVITATVMNITGLFGEIDVTVERQNRKTEGLTQKKSQYRLGLNEMTDVFLGIFRSCAKTTGNDDLYENSNMSVSEIKRIKDTEFMVTFNTTKRYAVNNLKELTEYGLTEDMIKEYDENGKGFELYLSSPQQIMAERKTATKHLKILFKRLDVQFVEFLDNHMMQYKTKEPQFYSDYTNARIIYNDPTTSKSLMGQITDSETGEPLQYAEILLRNNENNKIREYKKLTTQKGNFEFVGIPVGKCEIIVNKNYYETKTVNSEILPNDLKRLNIEITKAEKN